MGPLTRPQRCDRRASALGRCPAAHWRPGFAAPDVDRSGDRGNTIERVDHATRCGECNTPRNPAAPPPAACAIVRADGPRVLAVVARRSAGGRADRDLL